MTFKRDCPDVFLSFSVCTAVSCDSCDMATRVERRMHPDRCGFLLVLNKFLSFKELEHSLSKECSARVKLSKLTLALNPAVVPTFCNLCSSLGFPFTSQAPDGPPHSRDRTALYILPLFLHHSVCSLHRVWCLIQSIL
jgi:hypothetical protein